MKKTLSLVLVVLMVVAAFAVFTVASSADDTYTLTDGVLTLKADVDAGFNPSINRDKYPWAAERANITKVVVEDGVTFIGKYAFYGCANLTEVILGKDVTAINQYAFANDTALETITFKAPLVTAGEGIVRNSTLTKVYLANQSERDFAQVLAAQKYNLEANGGEKTGFDTCEYEVVGEAIHVAPDPIKIALEPNYGGLENWGTPRRTQFIVGIKAITGNQEEIRKDIQTKLKSGFAKLALVIRDETDGVNYYIPEYFFDLKNEFYNVGEFMRFVPTGYGIYPAAGHTFTLFIKVTDAEFGDVLYYGKSDESAFDTDNLKGEAAIVWDDATIEEVGLVDGLHTYETPEVNPIEVDEGPVTALTLERIEEYENGFENWGDPAQTQILFMPVPWDSSVYKKNFVVTVNMKANDGSSDDTFTLKVTSNYDGGDWGIARLQPCVDNTWVPVKGKEYTATFSFDDRTGNTLSATAVKNTAGDDEEPVYETAVYVMNDDPIVPGIDPPVTPTPTETPEPAEIKVSPFGTGMENWPSADPEATQLLFMIDPWDNDVYKNYTGKEITVTMSAEGKEPVTFTQPVYSVYPGGSWGILRLRPCADANDPWIPENGVAYTATLTFEAADGRTVTVVSDGTYTLDGDPVVPEPPTTTETPVTPTPTETPTTETPVLPEIKVEPFGTGMENWPSDNPEATQLLFCIDPWDNDVYKNYTGKEITVTMSAEGKEPVTFTQPVYSVYPGGSWGILRLRPCVDEKDPWIPENGVAYTATLTFEAADGRTVTVVSDGTYTLNGDPVVPEPPTPTTPTPTETPETPTPTETPTVTSEPTEEPTGDNTALFIVLALVAMLGTAVVVSKKVFSK